LNYFLLFKKDEILKDSSNKYLINDDEDSDDYSADFKIRENNFLYFLQNVKNT
jgi:hypothetical protein